MILIHVKFATRLALLAMKLRKLIVWLAIMTLIIMPQILTNANWTLMSVKHIVRKQVNAPFVTRYMVLLWAESLLVVVHVHLCAPLVRWMVLKVNARLVLVQINLLILKMPVMAPALNHVATVCLMIKIYVKHVLHIARRVLTIQWVLVQNARTVMALSMD